MENTMSLFKRNTTKKEIETLLNEIQINLENNYKDLAIKAFKDSSELIEKYHNTAAINEKNIHKNISSSWMNSQREWLGIVTD